MRRKIRRKAAVMTVAEVLPVKHLVTVNQRAKKVLQRKHLELLMKGRYTFVWFYFFVVLAFEALFL